MHLRIDTRDPQPMREQIANGLRVMIASGALREGAQLPSVRQIAGDLGVNLNTVAAAYRELQREGLLAIRRRAGCVVASRRAAADPEALKAPLRSALAKYVLAGHRPVTIRALVNRELQLLAGTGRP